MAAELGRRTGLVNGLPTSVAGQGGIRRLGRRRAFGDFPANMSCRYGPSSGSTAVR
jgi:hypothetical protein